MAEAGKVEMAPQETSTPEALQGSHAETRQQLENLKAALEKATAEKERYMELLQRAQAEFINFRRRVEEEREEHRRQAQSESILMFLPILDEYAQAQALLPPEGAGSDWAKGIELLGQKLRHALESQGLAPIDPLGKPFDPWEHEALAQTETVEQPDGTIIKVLRPGYKLRGKVLRPAQVIVARQPETKQQHEPHGLDDSEEDP